MIAHSRRALTGLLLVGLGFAAAPAADAEQVEIPLTVALRHLEPPLASALGLDQEEGRTLLVGDACNRVVLSDLELGIEGERLYLSMATTADGGRPLFNRCVGAFRWEGRLRAELTPTVGADGLAIALTPGGLQLLRSDGTEGLVSRAARPLAESLVLPRLRQARLDFGEQLAQIDELLGELAGLDEPAALRLIERSRMVSASVLAEEPAVGATVRFDIEAPPAAAAPAPALDPVELETWRRLEDELDGFLTTIIVRLAAQAQDRALRLDLLGVLLDARAAIAEALAEEGQPGESDPVRDLFVRSWDELRPHLRALEQAAPAGTAEALRLAGFLAGGDAIHAVDALGPEFGVEITRDGLRRLARMLLADEAPASFTPLPLELDPRLRELLYGDDANLLLRLRSDPEPRRPEFAWLAWLLPVARADELPATELARADLVPRVASLQAYLELIGRVLDEESEAHLAGTRIPLEYRAVIPALIRATAWKESCWRQFTGTPENPRVLTSAVGAMGIMQVHGRVWRGVYELDRLADDIRYNLAAGIEILEHYLVDYAIRRGEQDQPPGGTESLVRATYAAYNGGPSHLGRYRRASTAPRLQAIDREFWNHFQRISEHGWPEARSCYPVP